MTSITLERALFEPKLLTFESFVITDPFVMVLLLVRV